MASTYVRSKEESFDLLTRSKLYAQEISRLRSRIGMCREEVEFLGAQSFADVRKGLGCNACLNSVKYYLERLAEIASLLQSCVDFGVSVMEAEQAEADRSKAEPQAPPTPQAPPVLGDWLQKSRADSLKQAQQQPTQLDNLISDFMQKFENFLGSPNLPSYNGIVPDHQRSYSAKR